MLKLQIIGPYLYSLKLRGITGENSIHLQIIIPVFQRRSRSNVWEFYLICRVEKVNYSTNMRDNVETVIYCRLIDDLEISVIEGVSSGDISSISRNPTLTGSETQDHQPGTMFSETEDQLRNVRRVWSREEFLHETAGMGGPDMSMRPRLVQWSHEFLHETAGVGGPDVFMRPRLVQWSHEEFLHETAEVGGPDVFMRPRLVQWSHEEFLHETAEVGGPTCS